MITGDPTAVTQFSGVLSIERPVPRPATTAGPARGPLRRNRDFTLLWAGQAVSQLGTRAYGVATMLWVLAVTGSVARTGLISSVTLCAFALAQLPGGWLADRFDRRRVMVTCDAASALAALSLCIAAANGWFRLAHVLAAAIVLGIGWGVRGTAEVASLPDVLKPEELEGAAALSSARGHAAGLAGPPLAGNLFALSAAFPFLLDTVSYLFALVCAACVRTPLRTADARTRTASVRTELTDGLRAFWRVRFVRAAAALDAAAAFASNALALVVIVMLRDAHASVSTVGVVLAFGSVGGLCGAAIAARLRAQLSSPLPALIVAPVIGAAAICWLAASRGPVATGAGYAAFFVVWPVWGAVMTAQYLRRIDAELRGRVGGTAGLLIALSLATAPIATGALIASFGTRTTALALAGLLVVVAVAAASIRALREPVPAHELIPEPTEESAPVPVPVPNPPLLLRGSNHESAAPATSRDFQVKVGHPAAHDDAPQPCVLVMTRTADRDIDDLSLRLGAAGIPLVRLDSDRSVDEKLLWNPVDGVLSTGDGAFRPVVSWLRYFQTGAVPVPEDSRVAAYKRDQWSAWPPLMQTAENVRTINASTGPGTPDRVSQLAAARAAGFRTPATIVTNVPSEAAPALSGDQVIVKALGEHFAEPHPGRLIGLAPQRLTRAQLATHTEVEAAPVLVQEFLPSRRELRVYLVGGELFTYALEKPTTQALWDGDPGNQARAIPTPAELEDSLRPLAARWDLDVAAFDLLDTDEGLVFLEVNSACDWLWCERLADDAAVSKRVVGLVMELFDPPRFTTPRPVHHRSEAFAIR